VFPPQRVTISGTFGAEVRIIPAGASSSITLDPNGVVGGVTATVERKLDVDGYCPQGPVPLAPTPAAVDTWSMPWTLDVETANGFRLLEEPFAINTSGNANFDSESLQAVTYGAFFSEFTGGQLRVGLAMQSTYRKWPVQQSTCEGSYRIVIRLIGPKGVDPGISASTW
jgi:hypothetical protein